MCITCVDTFHPLQKIAAVDDVAELHGFAGDLFGFERYGFFFARLRRFLCFLFCCGPVATARGTDTGSVATALATDTRRQMIDQLLEDFAGFTFSDSNPIEIPVITQPAD